MKATAISAGLPDGWPGLVFRVLAGMALLAELPLVWNKIDGTNGSRVLAVLFFLAPGIPLLFWKKKFPGWLPIVVAAGTAGGAAMLIGDSLDHARQATARCCCTMAGARTSTEPRDLLTWSNGLMMLACLVSSLLLCPDAPVSWFKPASWMKHLGCLGGMWWGMNLGGQWLIPAFTEFFGLAGGMLMAMVAGMMAGAGLGHMIFFQSKRIILGCPPPANHLSEATAN